MNVIEIRIEPTTSEHNIQNDVVAKDSLANDGYNDCNNDCHIDYDTASTVAHDF